MAHSPEYEIGFIPEGGRPDAISGGTAPLSYPPDGSETDRLVEPARRGLSAPRPCNRAPRRSQAAEPKRIDACARPSLVGLLSSRARRRRRSEVYTPKRQPRRS